MSRKNKWNKKYTFLIVIVVFGIFTYKYGVDSGLFSFILPPGYEWVYDLPGAWTNPVSRSGYWYGSGPGNFPLDYGDDDLASYVWCIERVILSGPNAGTWTHCNVSMENYQKPPGSTDAEWYVVDIGNYGTSGDGINITIPPECWNAYPDVVKVTAQEEDTASGAEPGSSIHRYYCDDGTTSVLLYTTPEATGRGMFEQGMWWATPECMPIDSPGTYTLDEDIIDHAGSSCITITSSDVILDCQGYTIDGTDSGTYHGIFVNAPGGNNIIIKNCNVSDWGGYGIDAQEGSIFINNTILLSNNDGLRISSDNNVINNTIISSEDDGIVSLSSSDGNTFANCNFINNIDEALKINDDNLVFNSRFENNAVGILIESGDTNNVIYNNFFNNSINIDTSASPNYFYTAQTTATNIMGGIEIGGNFWANPSGTGFSETCTNLDSDSFCDDSYIIASGNTDLLPLTVDRGLDDGQPCTDPADCEGGYCNDNVCTSYPSAYVKVMPQIQNTGNTDLDAYVSSITSDNSYIESKFGTITGTKMVAQATSDNWDSDFIDTSIIPDGTYTVDTEICAQDTNGVFTEECSISSTSLTFLSGVYVP